ncbi:hypothetical protein NQZ68_007099 [Dissostichus eleginoides]|nr:hypothetical protein NQZ68_007099 [Dissostichus eleginoides]
MLRKLAGGRLWEQPGSEWRIHLSRKAKHFGPRGCTLATGPFWGLYTEPPTSSSSPPWPVKISPNKTWRRVADLEKEG